MMILKCFEMVRHVLFNHWIIVRPTLNCAPTWVVLEKMTAAKFWQRRSFGWFFFNYEIFFGMMFILTVDSFIFFFRQESVGLRSATNNLTNPQVIVMPARDIEWTLNITTILISLSGRCAVLITGTERSLVTKLDAANLFTEDHLQVRSGSSTNPLFQANKDRGWRWKCTLVIFSIVRWRKTGPWWSLPKQSTLLDSSSL